MTWTRTVGIAVLALVASACGPRRTEKTEADLQQAIAEALTRGDTATLRLFIEVPFALDRVYIAGPGTSESAIAEALRSNAWRPEFSRGVESATDFHLLVFQTGASIVSAKLPRSVADIAPEIVGRVYNRDNAVFSVRRSPDAGVPVLQALPAPPESATSARE